MFSILFDFSIVSSTHDLGFESMEPQTILVDSPRAFARSVVHEVWPTPFMQTICAASWYFTQSPSQKGWAASSSRKRTAGRNPSDSNSAKTLQATWKRSPSIRWGKSCVDNSIPKSVCRCSSQCSNWPFLPSHASSWCIRYWYRSHNNTSCLCISPEVSIIRLTSFFI